jgi:N-acetylmuramoyl-L-alanine amidase
MLVSLCRRSTPLVVVAASLCCVAPVLSSDLITIDKIRFWSLGDVTRVVIETSAETTFSSDKVENPDRVFFDLRAQYRRKYRTIDVNDARLKQIRIAARDSGVTRIVFDLAGAAEYSFTQMAVPDRVIIELRRKGTAVPPSPGGLVLPSGAVSPRVIEAAGSGRRPRFSPPPSRLAGPFLPPVLPPPPMLLSGVAAFEVPQPPEVALSRIRMPKRVPAVHRNRDAAKPALGAVSAPSVMMARNAPPATSAPAAVELGLANNRTPASLADRSNTGAVAGDSGSPVAPVERTSLDRPRSPSPESSAPRTAGTPASPARVNSAGGRSMTRVLGLKVGRIVIDAGHGGHDHGTTGPGGLAEKDLVLDVAHRLGSLIEDRLGSEVIYTRPDDTYIPLEQRTAIANEKHADLFLSIHANSSQLETASGVETYYLNFTSAKDALEVAARENSSSNKTVFELRDLLQKIAQKDKAEESREFATRVQAALTVAAARGGAPVRNRGVKRAPFVVLIGARMPSVLAEIGFVSNPRDETLLRKSEYRQRIAEALYKGLAGYASTLSHFQMAKGLQ